MCGRTTLTITPDDLKRAFGYTPPPGYRPRYNVAPTQEILAIADGGEGPGFRMFRWGLVPFWAEDPGIGNRLINARAETASSKPAFRAAFRKRRCLIVVDGYYEWQVAPGGKRPHRICKRSREPFVLAGLWERWDRGGSPLESCTILTTEANPATRAVHDRMPVILPRGEWAAWLDPAVPAAALEPMLRPYEPDDLEVYEVATLVNSPANDVPACVERLVRQAMEPAEPVPDLFAGGSAAVPE